MGLAVRNPSASPGLPRHIALMLAMAGMLSTAVGEPEPRPPTAARSAPSALVENSGRLAQRPSLAAAGRFMDLFRPPRTDAAALSPDGRHLAYTLREGGRLSLLIVDAHDPEKALTKKIVETDSAASDALGENREETPAQIRWIGWPAPGRLVVETNRNFSYADDNESWRGTAGAILALDADGTNASVLVTPRDVAKLGFNSPIMEEVQNRRRTPLGQGLASERSNRATAMFPDPTDFSSEPASTQAPLYSEAPRSPRIVGYCRDDADSLYVRGEDSGRGSFGLYRMNIRTGKLRPEAEDVAEPDMSPLFDRQGRLRVVVSTTTDRSFPHAYLYDVNRGLNRWKELDRLVKFEGATFSVSPANFYGTRAMPVAFDENPDVLYFASNAGHDTYGIYGLNLKTGLRTDLALQSPAYDLVSPGPGGFPPETTLIFSRYEHTLAGVRFDGGRRTTRWLLPELQTVQLTLEASLPGRGVQILDWDKPLARFLVLARGPADPGAYYIYSRQEKKLIEFARCSPWIDEKLCHPAADFSIPATGGVHLTGIVTMPLDSLRKTLPVIVVCPASPLQRAGLEFNPGVQALAQMGYVVVEINSRRTWGYGLARRSPGTASFEETLAADIFTVLEELAHQVPIDLRHAVLFGERHGAYTALRILQLHPDRFRCAVALDALTDLPGWLDDLQRTSREAWPALVYGQFAAAGQQQGHPLTNQSHPIERPIYLLANMGDNQTDDDNNAMRNQTGARAKALTASQRSRGIPTEFTELPAEYLQGLPRAKAAIYAQIEDFLNLYVYNYTVKLGPTEIIESDVPLPPKQNSVPSP